MPLRLSDVESGVLETQPREDQTVATIESDKPDVMRMSDVESFEPVELNPEINDGLIEIPEEKKSEWKEKGRIGFFEQWGRLDKTEMLPFWGGAETAFKGVSLLNSINRLKKNEYQNEDLRTNDEEKISNYLVGQEEQRIRGVSVPGKILSGVTQLPSFILEFVSTGGLAAIGKAGVKKAATVALKQGAEAGVTKLAARMAAPIAGAAVRTVGMPQRIAAGATQRMVESNFELTDKGVQIRQEAEETPVISSFKAIGDVMIENYSEVAGTWIAKAGGALVPQGLARSMEKVFSKLRPGEAVRKLWTKAGYNGFLAEMGEERLGDLLRAVTGVEDFGAKNPDQIVDRIVSSIPNGEELLVEAGVLSVPGMAQFGTSQAIDLIRKTRTAEKEKAADSQVVNQDILEGQEEEIQLDIEISDEEAQFIADQVQESKFEEDKGTEQDETQDNTNQADLVEENPADTFNEFTDSVEEPVREELQRISETEEFKEKAERVSELQGIVDTFNAKKAVASGAGEIKIRRFKGGYLSEELSAIPKKFFTSNSEAQTLDELADSWNVSIDEAIAILQSNAITKNEIATVAAAKKELQEIESEMQRKNPQIKESVESITRKSPRIKLSQSQLIKRLFKERFRGEKQGFRSGREQGRKEVMSAKEILDRRRARIKGLLSSLGLSDSDLKKITQRDIRLMGNYEFKLFIDQMEAMASTFAEKRQIKNQILFNIQDKELKKTDNLRQALKLPPIEKMSIDQLNQLNDILEEAQQGDEFLSVRKLETVKNTDLAGIKTIREAKEILAKKLGVPLSSVDNINVSALDKFLFDTALARRNPFYQFLVDETNASLIEGEQRFLEMETEVDDLTNKARASRKRSLVDKLVPTDEIVFEWLEAPADKKKSIADKMTNEEIDLANYLQKRFAEFRDYLVQHEVLKKFKNDYITHIRRGFLETWKADGFLEAFKEVFKAYQEDEAVFKILEDDTQNILPLEKFFQFSMKRTGELKPSQNVAKAFKAYTKAMIKKQSLDKIIPALDIYAYTLSPKNLTPRGLQMNRQLIKFVREWVNNKKGRKTSFGGVLPQNGAVDMGLRTIDAFVTLLDLGLNIPVGITVQIGEQVSTFVNLGSKKYSTGIIRMNTEKGKSLIRENEGLIGKSPWRDLSNAASDIGEKFHKGMFMLFELSNVRANKIHFLGSLTEEEYNSGKVSPEKLAEIRRDIGRFRNVPGAKSIFGSTSAGSALTKYKTWALPILNTVVDDLAKLVTMTKKSDFYKTREFQELFRGTVSTALIVLAAKGMVDDDDRSFIGELIKKSYRESLTFLGALDPRVLTSVRLLSFLQDLSASLAMIATLEKYKTKSGYKGVAKLQRTLTPRAVKSIAKEIETSGAGKRRFN